nr:MAG TPA: hypothetical protein [Caudoviricetes sp.]
MVIHLSFIRSIAHGYRNVNKKVTVRNKNILTK